MVICLCIFAMKLDNKKIIEMLLDGKGDIFIKNLNKETRFSFIISLCYKDDKSRGKI